MNAVKGTYRLIYEDMRWFLILFSSITVLIAAIYLAIGALVDISFPATIFGPIYGGVCTIAAVGIVISFPVAIGLGSTRKQFLKSFYVITSWMVVSFITILNIVTFIMQILNKYGIHKLNIYHPGMLYSTEYHFLVYFWIDLMIGYLLVGLTAFLTVLWRRIGVLNFLVLFFVINLLATLIVTNIDISPFVEWITQLKEQGLKYYNVLFTFTVFGIFGNILLALTYPIMKNGPLTMKGSKS